MQPGGADCLPLVGPEAITELQLSKTKTHCEGKPMQSGGADSLPLVGRGTSAESRLLKTKTHYEERPMQSGGAGLPPVGRPTELKLKIQSERRPWRRGRFAPASRLIVQ